MEDKRINVWIQRFKGRTTLALQWFDPDTGQRKTKKTETDDPEKTEKARADHEYELNHGIYEEASKMDWEKFRQLFEDEYLPGMRLTTREKYQSVFDVFEAIINPSKLRKINERTLSLFVKGMRERTQPNGKKGLAPITMRKYLIALKTALGWAVHQKLLPRLPAFPTIKVPKKKPQPIDQEVFDKLLAAATDEFWRTYLLCGWWGGLRLSEARQLQWQSSEKLPWVNFKQNRIVLPAAFAKSGEDQIVPLHPTLQKALASLPRNGMSVFPFVLSRSGEPLSRNGITTRIRDMAVRAGVKLTMHQLRKGFGCRVAKQLGKGNAPVLHSLMRHSSMQITMDYYASVDDVLQEAINQLV